MSSVLGIDYSTRGIDLVYLDESTDAARWHHIPLSKGIAGLRQIRHTYAWGAELEDVYLVAIEDAFSAGRAQAKHLGRVAGAVVASLPLSIADEHVWVMRPDEWRMACGMKGSAGKDEVMRWAHENLGARGWLIDAADLLTWGQDACDAYCIAYAAREINAKAVAAA